MGLFGHRVMSSLILTLKSSPPVPVEAEVLSPDVVAGLSLSEVAGLPIAWGNRQGRLGDLFDVDGGGGEELELRGDLSRVKWIGRGMTRGRITIVGDAGMHLGAQMSGGEIRVQGNASDWVGAEMTGGHIRIRGDAGGQVGGAYRGSPEGMRGGTVLIDGHAGMEVGMRMRRGLIVVAGPVGDFAGVQMRGGSLFLLGGSGLRTGAWMRRGTIVAYRLLRLLPTFLYDCTYQPVFLRPYLRTLAMLGVPLPPGAQEGPYLRYTGDTSELGRGEILLWQPAIA